MTENEALPMDYWENVEQYREKYRDGETIQPAPGVTRRDLEETALELIRERTDDMWRVLGTMLADRDEQDGTMFLLIVRYGVGDGGNLLLDERYFVLDPRDPWTDGSGYTSNGITRRVAGEGLLLGLRVLYAAIADGSDRLADMSPQTLEASNGQLVHNPDALLEELADLLGLPEPDTETRTCRRCEQPIGDDEQAISMPGDLGDIWIHDPDAGGCEQ